MATLDKSYKKLRNIALHSLQSLSSNIIVKVKDDFVVFNRYKISPTQDGYYSLYRNDTLVHEFTNSRNALAFCILENRARIEEARQLVSQDKRIQRLEVDIDRQSRIIETTKDADRRELMAMRLTQNVAERGQVKIMLQSTIELAKYYQQKGFDNETARTRNK